MSLRVLSTPLQGSSLARIAIGGARDSQWFVARPSSASEWRHRSAQIRESLIETDWLAALSPAFEATGAAHDRLARAAQSGFVVTAGQQPGLFGGPLYTWWKALSAVALADRLEEITGLPVAPVFWAATDDSDFAEASYTVVATSDGAERIEIKSNPAEGKPLSEIPVQDLAKQLAMLSEAAGSASNASVIAEVRSAYSQGNTLGSAYVDLLRNILAPLGVSVLDASHPAVRTTAFPLLTRALERSQQVEDALSSRVAELKAAGHSAQVKLVPGRSLVFSDESGARTRIATKEAQEVVSAARSGTLGPNVLLRPVVESSILPTVAYLGGPAEVAYFAQVTSVAAALDVPAPLVLPRWSGVVIEPRIQRLLDKHSLQVEDFRDPHAVETRMARASVPDALKEKIRSLSESVTRLADELSHTEGADLAPPSVVEGLKRHMSHRLSRLERRFAAGVKKRGSEGLHDATILRGSLFPMRVPQERALNGIPLIARYGPELFEAVMEETRKHAAKLA